jgi:hypothetical protein
MPTITEHPPVKPITKHEFKVPLDMLENVAELKGMKAPVAALTVAPTPLLGTWVNCDKATRGLLKLEITLTGKDVFVHAFGACHPTPCDWQKVPAMVYAENVCATPAVAFTAQYKFNFVETLIVGRLEFGALIVETFEHFIDGSGRADYNGVYFMNRV